MATTKIQRVKPLTIRDARRRWMMAYGTDEQSLAGQEIVTTSDQKRLWRGDGTMLSGGVDHGTVATEAALATIYLLPSCTRGVWPGDTAWVTSAGCEYRCISGSNAAATWRPSIELPSSMPPSAHGHSVGDVTGLGPLLAGKSTFIGDFAAITPLLEADAPVGAVATISADSLVLLCVSYPSNTTDAWVSWSSTPAEEPAALTDEWVARATAAGGTYTSAELGIYLNLLTSLQVGGVLAKMRRLDGWLGTNLAARITPLIDSLNRGVTNHGLVDADFSDSTGVTFAADTGYLDTYTAPSLLGTGGCGGLGWWPSEAYSAGEEEPIGCANASDHRYFLDLRGSFVAFRWGSNTYAAQTSSQVRSGDDYYGQRSSASSRALYKNGGLLVENNQNDTTTIESSRSIVLGGADYNGRFYQWVGRCKVAYMTDGTLTPAEITSLHNALAAFVAATGR